MLESYWSLITVYKAIQYYRTRVEDGKNYTYPPQWIRLGMLLPLQAAQEVGGGV